MVVQQRSGDLAIVTNGSAGYLVVEILGEAETYEEAQEILEDEQSDGGDDDEEDDEGEFE